MPTTTIRVRRSTRERLAQIGARRGLSMPDLLDRLAAEAEEQDLLTSANEHFAATADERRDEIAAWDATVSDGLPAGERA
jgi:predicted DNA-binding ribbon-helix-helix protein